MKILNCLFVCFFCYIISLSLLISFFISYFLLLGCVVNLLTFFLNYLALPVLNRTSQDFRLSCLFDDILVGQGWNNTTCKLKHIRKRVWCVLIYLSFNVLQGDLTSLLFWNACSLPRQWWRAAAVTELQSSEQGKSRSWSRRN